MKVRTRIELTVLTLWVIAMIMWGVSCVPGHCMERLYTWLTLWWGGGGIILLYAIWRNP